jgi:signal transduction histidine kinase
MNGIIWSIGTIRDDAGTPIHIKALAEDMRVHAAGLLETTNNILAAYAVDTKTRPSKEKIQVKERVKKAVDSFSLIAKKKGQQIDLGLIPDDAVIEANSVQIDRVFSNVISNAIKYSPEGSTITIRYDDKDNMHSISVTDNGIGIPESELSKVTSGFYRASNATETSVEGSGLGLNLVKKIVDNHDGKLNISSKVGEGTTVRVSFSKIM